MEFSEAIRAGKKWADIRSQYELGCQTCAIGGAVRAALDCAEINGNVIQHCQEIWPELARRTIQCPLHGETDSDGRVSDCEYGGYEELANAGGSPFAVASHLFSDHGWSKDEVAKWVEENIES